MTHSIVLLLALLIGVVAGLRSLTAPAVVAWAAFLHWINMDGTWAQWISHPVTVTVLTVLALAELVVDLRPGTGDRVNVVPFAVRIILGGLAGAVIGTAWEYPWGSLGAGMIGAVLGTVGGYRARRRMTAGDENHDLPVALLEDTIAVLGGLGIAALTSLPL